MGTRCSGVWNYYKSPSERFNFSHSLTPPEPFPNEPNSILGLISNEPLVEQKGQNFWNGWPCEFGYPDHEMPTYSVWSWRSRRVFEPKAQGPPWLTPMRIFWFLCRFCKFIAQVRDLPGDLSSTNQARWLVWWCQNGRCKSPPPAFTNYSISLFIVWIMHAMTTNQPVMAIPWKVSLILLLVTFPLAAGRLP